MTIVGARPQFIKASALSRAVAARADMRETLVHTGQHYDDNMSSVFFTELGMAPPDRSLGIGGGSHGEMTGRMLAPLEALMLELRPDVVLIYGDTNSTLAGALAGAKLNIPIAHVEAGLRSFNRRMPEEINRVLADHASTYLFCPTDQAVANLAREGIGREVHNVGDIMYDVALHAGAAAAASAVLDRQKLAPGGYVLATIHRQENTDDPDRLRGIFEGLAHVAREIPVVLPLHPRTAKSVAELGIDGGALRLIEPVGYLDMARLEQGAALIATDSGGVQKEAFFHRVPCITLRDETEWTELVDSGWNRLADVSSGSLARQMLAALGTRGKDEFYPYGKGDTAERILDVLS
jgi:UDP-GlcNAc3NAcA epimerase